MRGFVGNTDHGWYRFLRARPEITEVNFWRPGSQRFAALRPGEPFFFKLKSPYNAIGGFGLFARYASLPIWQAWDVFGPANGTADIHELLIRLGRLSAGASRSSRMATSVIGCIAVTEPIFFAPDDWVQAPTDWARNIVSGKRYDLSSGDGSRIWRECLERAADMEGSAQAWVSEALAEHRVGKPQLILPRLGQSSFRLAVLDAYDGQCAVTTEHSLPVLHAAHIRPWAAGGKHEVRNGIPLRSDIHRLFDLGYVTVRPDLRFAVSHRLNDEFANGKEYYALDGHRIHVPSDAALQPDRESLEWHGDVVFQP